MGAVGLVWPRQRMLRYASHAPTYVRARDSDAANYVTVESAAKELVREGLQPIINMCISLIEVYYCSYTLSYALIHA